jgi:hypothetical protein
VTVLRPKPFQALLPALVDAAFVVLGYKRHDVCVHSHAQLRLTRRGVVVQKTDLD